MQAPYFNTCPRQGEAGVENRRAITAEKVIPDVFQRRKHEKMVEYSKVLSRAEHFCWWNCLPGARKIENPQGNRFWRREKSHLDHRRKNNGNSWEHSKGPGRVQEIQINRAEKIKLDFWKLRIIYKKRKGHFRNPRQWVNDLPKRHIRKDDSSAEARHDRKDREGPGKDSWDRGKVDKIQGLPLTGTKDELIATKFEW